MLFLRCHATRLLNVMCPAEAAHVVADASQARDQADEELFRQQAGDGMEPTLAPPASLAPDAAAAADTAAAEPELSADETCGSADEPAEEGDGDMQLQQPQLMEEGGEAWSPAGSCGQAYETVRDYCLKRTQVGSWKHSAV